MTAKRSIVAKIVANDGDADGLRDLLCTLVDAGRSEDGLEIYSVHEDPRVPGEFYFFELYSNSDAVRRHGSGGEMKELFAQIGKLANKPTAKILTPLAAKGIPL